MNVPCLFLAHKPPTPQPRSSVQRHTQRHAYTMVHVPRTTYTYTHACLGQSSLSGELMLSLVCLARLRACAALQTALRTALFFSRIPPGQTHSGKRSTSSVPKYVWLVGCLVLIGLLSVLKYNFFFFHQEDLSMISASFSILFLSRAYYTKLHVSMN